MKYVRLFAGPDGETHFEDVTVTFNLRDVPPQPPFSASDAHPVDRFVFVSFPPGWQDEHSAPRRQFIVVLGGVAGLRTSDGELRDFKPGDVFLAEDTTGNGHDSWNDGEDTLLAAVIPLRD